MGVIVGKGSVDAEVVGLAEDYQGCEEREAVPGFGVGEAGYRGEARRFMIFLVLFVDCRQSDPAVDFFDF